MDEAKKNRLAAATTVAAVLLLVVLTVVLICQIAALVNQNREKQRLLSEISMYEKNIEDEENYLKYLKSQQYLYDLLIHYNYRPKN